jgi:hypothetical protein
MGYCGILSLIAAAWTPADLQATFELPPCTQLFTLERICWVLRLMLGKLKVWKCRGGWVG